MIWMLSFYEQLKQSLYSTHGFHSLVVFVKFLQLDSIGQVHYNGNKTNIPLEIHLAFLGLFIMQW